MIVVDSYGDMFDLLYNYSKDILEIEEIRQKMQGVRSPILSDEPKGKRISKFSQYNRFLQRIEELNERVKFVQDSVDSLKDVNEDYYRIINHKWLIRYPNFPNGHPSLEYIAERILYMSRCTFFRKQLYSKAKDSLFDIMKS